LRADATEGGWTCTDTTNDRRTTVNRRQLGLEWGRMRPDPIQCYDCGWTGRFDDLESIDTGTSCPVCSTVIINYQREAPTP
jgi:predicted Zn-ribbon and HTH transcriptional regulator